MNIFQVCLIGILSSTFKRCLIGDDFFVTGNGTSGASISYDKGHPNEV